MNRWTRLRWRLWLIGVIDWLLGTHLVDEAASGWRGELEVMGAEIATLQARIEELNASRRAILRHLCLSYLQLRQVQSPDGWLHFNPRVPPEESAIDILTRALVTPHWARWRIVKVATEGEDVYTYDLVPDWAALHQEARTRAASLPAGLLDWLGEQMEKKMER
jgi:hypothetical protein